MAREAHPGVLAGQIRSQNSVCTDRPLWTLFVVCSGTSCMSFGPSLRTSSALPIDPCAGELLAWCPAIAAAGRTGGRCGSPGECVSHVGATPYTDGHPRPRSIDRICLICRGVRAAERSRPKSLAIASVPAGLAVTGAGEARRCCDQCVPCSTFHPEASSYLSSLTVRGLRSSAEHDLRITLPGRLASS